MVTWTQMYMPMGGLGLSALVALIPIIFFFVALAVLRLKGHVAGAITLILSILIAIFAFKMPIDMAFAAAGYGFIYGLWPIAWIIVAAVFLYKLTVASGQFDIIRSSVISITDDQRLQVLLIGFSFGALLEGAAGFGAPVAITGALLVGLGFKPLYAAGLCLIANTAPVAFGALGVPILVAGQVTGIDPFDIGAMAGRQLPFLSVLVPFWLVAMMDGWKGVKETWPAALVAGGSFAVTQFFTSNYIGPELPDITSALVSIVSLSLFLKVWRPKNTETAISMGQSAGAMVVNKPSSGGPVPSEYRLGQIIRAWSPFLILTVLVTIWTMKPFKALFAPGGAFYSLVINFQIPHLHQQVLKAAPIVAQPTPMDAVFKFDPLSAGGTAIFIAAIISIFILGVGIKKGIGVFAETLISLKWPILSIGMVLAFAFVTNYSGMSTTLALYMQDRYLGKMNRVADDITVAPEYLEESNGQAWARGGAGDRLLMYAQLKEWAEKNFDITKWYPDGKLPAFYSEREGMKGWNLFQLMHRKARGDDVGNSTFGGKNYCAESNGNAADTLMLCASWVAQTDLSEFFKKWNPGANAYQLPGAAEMSFEGGVSQSAYNTLASLKLPKPEQGPENMNKVTEHKMSAE